MNPIEFARLLAGLELHLAWAAGQNSYHSDPAAAASYLYLLDRLAPVDSDEVADAIAGAVVVYERESRRARQDDEDRRARQAAEYQEAERRHEFAVKVECPYCGAAPGLVCRTSTGHPRGVYVHVGRWRAAEHLTAGGQAVP